MAEYGLSLSEAIDVTAAEAIGLRRAAIKRRMKELELLSMMNANAIGKMLFGEGKEGPKTKGGEKKMKAKGKKETAYWSGGRSSNKPDLSPNPKRKRLKELAEMEPRPIDDFALSQFMKIDQSK